jgi:hypothetical protein
MSDGLRFRSANGVQRAACQLWSHQFGWELWITIDGELHRSQVCRSQEEVLDMIDRWKAALLAKGWEVVP